jgi:hypothetical protein
MWKLILLGTDKTTSWLLCPVKIYSQVAKEIKDNSLNIIEVFDRETALLDPGGPLQIDTDAIEIIIDNHAFALKAEHLLKVTMMFNSAIGSKEIAYVNTHLYTLAITYSMYKELQIQLSSNKSLPNAYLKATETIEKHFVKPPDTMLLNNIIGEA